jgi:hypothetical protein
MLLPAQQHSTLHACAQSPEIARADGDEVSRTGTPGVQDATATITRDVRRFVRDVRLLGRPPDMAASAAGHARRRM